MLFSTGALKPSGVCFFNSLHIFLFKPSLIISCSLLCYNSLTIPLVRLFLTRQHSHKHSRYIHKHGNNRNMYTGTQAQTQLLQVPSLFHMSCLPYPSSHSDCSCAEVWGRSCTLHCVSILQSLC